jgi:Amidohydrolase
LPKAGAAGPSASCEISKPLRQFLTWGSSYGFQDLRQVTRYLAVISNDRFKKFGGRLIAWATQIARAAEHRNVAMKLSIGLDVIMRWRWSTPGIRRYSDHVLDLFGPERVMAASYWPVILLGASYEEAWRGIIALVVGLSADQQRAVLGDTATRIGHSARALLTVRFAIRLPSS